MQWYTYLIDPLRDFRNSSNVTNDNEPDSHTMANTYTMNPR